jgi:hypothetical protein
MAEFLEQQTGLVLFANQLPHELAHDLATARRAKVVPKLLLSHADLDAVFEEIVSAGTIKWVVNAQNQLVIIPKTAAGLEIKHPVMTRGAAVLAAGRAEICGTAAQFLGLEINSWSDHFRPSSSSLALGRAAFASLGIIFP